jgi:hypothetical protein
MTLCLEPHGWVDATAALEVMGAALLADAVAERGEQHRALPRRPYLTADLAGSGRETSLGF